MITGPVYLVEASFFEICARAARDPSQRNLAQLATAVEKFSALQKQFQSDVKPKASCERCGNVVTGL